MFLNLALSGRFKLRLGFIYQDDFAERVIGNLCNTINFCRACGLICENCRFKYGSFAGDIQYAYKMPINLPAFIEEPKVFLPNKIPECDVIIAVGLHPDILLALPIIVQAANAEAAIVPIEDKRWCQPGLRNQLKKLFSEIGIEICFPKPFCSLEASNNPIIEEFVKRYAIGKPEIEVEVKGSTIVNATVIRSAPCGSTWYVTQQIRGKEISKIEDVVAKAHHSYPCTASMEIDEEIGDAILHKAGYMIRETVKNAIQKALRKKGLI